jgi:hypothetical protein
MYLRGTPQTDGAVTGEGADCSVWSLSSSTTTTSKWTALRGFFPFQNRILESESAIEDIFAVETVLWETKSKEQQLVRRNGGKEGVGVGRRRRWSGRRAAVSKLNILRGLPSRVSFSVDILFPLFFRNLFVVPLYRGNTPLKRVTSLSPPNVGATQVSVSLPLHNSCTYCRSSFLYRLNNAFASVTTCDRDLFSDLYLGFDNQLATCSFWCITSRSVLTFRSNWRCAWARFVAVLSTAFCEHTHR